METVSRAKPIDIAATSRHDSPRFARNSDSTSALQTTSGNESRPVSAMDGPVKFGSGFGGSQYDCGAQPISVNSSSKGKLRRESLAGSMVTGMSWGGTSVGSWIRDDIIMQGTSPFAPYQSPSFHSSSYLPKLEANFMRGFNCCGFTLDSLHDLVQHYEEQHAGSLPHSMQKQNPRGNERYDSKVAVAANTAAAIQGQGRAQERPAPIDLTRDGQASPQSLSTPATPRQAPSGSQQYPRFPRDYSAVDISSTQEDDTVGDLEMDDDGFAPPSNPLQQLQYPMQHQGRTTAPSQFGLPASGRVPPLDVNTLNVGNPRQQQYQGLRNSQPTTPVSAGRNGNMFHNNPTVSSVNTPTLSTYNTSNTHPLQQQQFYTPESSVPGTPGELDRDFMADMGHMNMESMHYVDNPQDFSEYGFGDNSDRLGQCIDDPAKRLFALNGGYSSHPQQTSTSATQLGDAQYSENSELAKTIREEQKRAGVPEPPLDGGVAKPFHCPVIGCEKAYKNQNGLKYHKSHGHNSQKLQTNANGTYSIVDPETLVPYQGTLGMEKHKPFRCPTCGKRYKNLNGLKYHKVHTPNCDRPSPAASPKQSPRQSSMPYQYQQTDAAFSKQSPSGADDMIL